MSNKRKIESLSKTTLPKMPPSSIQVKAVSNNEGKLLFIEVERNFVDLLLSLQRIPAGSLARIAGNNNALTRMQISMGGLREVAFNDGVSREKVSGEDLILDMEELLQGKKEMEKEVKVEVVTGNVNCEGTGSGPYTVTNMSSGWEEGVAFRGLGDSFEVAIKNDNNTRHSIFIGILPDDKDLIPSIKDGRNTFGNKGCFLHKNSSHVFSCWPGNIDSNLSPGSGPQEIRMRFQHSPSPKLEFSLKNGPWDIHSNPMKHISLPNGIKCCPVIILDGTRHSAVKVLEVSGSKKQILKNSKSVLSPNMTFLVTCDMDIMESGSFGTTLQLLQRFNIADVNQLKVESVQFGIDELKRLISALVRGEQDLLTPALLLGPTESVDDTGTEASFDMAGMGGY